VANGQEHTVEAGPQEEEGFDLSLTGTGISLSRKVDRDAALQILAIAMGGGQQAQRQQQEVARSGDRVALREYINQVEATRNPDKILAIGKYLVQYRGQKSFTSTDVKAQFRAAAEAIPGNFPRDFRWAVTNGWIAEDPATPGEYYITSSGEAALSARFSGDVKKKTGQSKLGGRRRKKKTDNSDTEE
jgi:hypothetical protein